MKELTLRVRLQVDCQINKKSYILPEMLTDLDTNHNLDSCILVLETKEFGLARMFHWDHYF